MSFNCLIKMSININQILITTINFLTGNLTLEDDKVRLADMNLRSQRPAYIN